MSSSSNYIFYSGSNIVLQSGSIIPFAIPASYVIFSGSIAGITGPYYGLNGITNNIDFANINANIVMQAVINAIPSGKIYIKSGVYNINANITGKSDIIIEGSSISDTSSTGTILKAIGSTTTVLDFTSKTHVGLYNLNIDGNNIATTGVDFGGGSLRNLHRIDKCTIQNCLGIGLNLSNNEDSEVHNCLITRCNVGLNWVQPDSSASTIGTIFGRCTDAQARVGGTQHNFTDCVFTQFTPPAQGPVTAHISIDGFTSTLNLIGCWFETPTGSSVVTSGSTTLQQLNINGCYFTTASGSSVINNALITVLHAKSSKFEQQNKDTSTITAISLANGSLLAILDGVNITTTSGSMFLTGSMNGAGLIEYGTEYKASGSQVFFHKNAFNVPISGSAGLQIQGGATFSGPVRFTSGSVIITGSSGPIILENTIPITWRDTSGSTSTRLVLQGDNNFVFYVSDDTGSIKPIWSIFSTTGSRDFVFSGTGLSGSSIRPNVDAQIDFGMPNLRWRAGSFQTLTANDIFSPGTIMTTGSTTITYDSQQRILTGSYGDSTVTYSYDNISRVSSTVNKIGSKTITSTYTYDANGNISNITYSG